MEDDRPIPLLVKLLVVLLITYGGLCLMAYGIEIILDIPRATAFKGILAMEFGHALFGACWKKD